MLVFRGLRLEHGLASQELSDTRNCSLARKVSGGEGDCGSGCDAEWHAIRVDKEEIFVDTSIYPATDEGRGSCSSAID